MTVTEDREAFPVDLDFEDSDGRRPSGSPAGESPGDDTALVEEKTRQARAAPDRHDGDC